MTVGTVKQPFIGGDIVVDFDIGSKPNFVACRKFLADLFDAIPIVIVIEFVAVSPNVEQAAVSSGVVGIGGGIELQKLVDPLKDLGIVMVCRRDPGMKIRRKHKRVVVSGKGTGIGNIKLGQNLFDRFIISEIAEQGDAAVRIGHAADNTAAFFLKCQPAVKHFAHAFDRPKIAGRAVICAMDGNFVAFVEKIRLICSLS